MTKFNLSKLRNFDYWAIRIKKIPWILGEKVFLTLLVLIFIIIILGIFIFYKYGILTKKQIPEVFEKSFQFEEKAYQEVLKEWQKKEESFIEIDKKEYLDLFQKERLQKIEESEIRSHIVVKGETLWELAERYLSSGERWREIKTEAGEVFTENAAELLPVGLKLIIPSK